jgi:predicted MFS family arabinose efflux permease
MKRFLNRPLRILLITDTLVLISAAMIVPIYAVFVAKIGGDILDAGMAAGVFAMVAGLTVIVAGKMSDRSKRLSKIVGWGYMLNGLGFFLYLFVGSIWQLLAVQVLIGLSQACITPAFDALYTKHIGGTKHASSRWSMWEAGNYFAIAIGSAAGAVIVHLTSFNVLFIAMSTLCFCSGLYVLTRPKRVF